MYNNLTKMMRVAINNFYRVSTQANPSPATAKFRLAKDIDASLPRKHMNLFESVNSALDIALETDKTYFFA